MHIIAKLLAILVLLMLPASAFAQTPPYAYPITVGTSSVQILAANNARKRLVFENPNAAALVRVCPTLTCALGGAGSITLFPSVSIPIDGYGQNGVVPRPWSAISDTPGAALTILEFE